MLLKVVAYLHGVPIGDSQAYRFLGAGQHEEIKLAVDHSHDKRVKELSDYSPNMIFPIDSEIGKLYCDYLESCKNKAERSISSNENQKPRGW